MPPQNALFGLGRLCRGSSRRNRGFLAHPRLGLLDDAGGLPAETAEIIELRPADFATTDHDDRVDHRRVDREDALDALAVGNLPYGEVFVEAAARPRDADALIGLDAGTCAFGDAHIDADRIAGREVGDRALCGDDIRLLLLELL